MRTRGMKPGLDGDCSRAARCRNALGRMRAGGPGEVRSDRPLVMRFPWWRAEGIEGEIHSTGRRLNGNRMVLAAEVHPGFGPDGCPASAQVFPSDSSWEVMAWVGAAQLTFVTGARGLPEVDRGRTFGRQLGAACPQPLPRSGSNPGQTGQRVIGVGLESSAGEESHGLGYGGRGPR